MRGHHWYTIYKWNPQTSKIFSFFFTAHQSGCASHHSFENLPQSLIYSLGFGPSIYFSRRVSSAHYRGDPALLGRYKTQSTVLVQQTSKNNIYIVLLTHAGWIKDSTFRLKVPCLRKKHKPLTITLLHLQFKMMPQSLTLYKRDSHRRHRLTPPQG